MISNSSTSTLAVETLKLLYTEACDTTASSINRLYCCSNSSTLLSAKQNLGTFQWLLSTIIILRTFKGLEFECVKFKHFSRLLRTRGTLCNATVCQQKIPLGAWNVISHTDQFMTGCERSGGGAVLSMEQWAAERERSGGHTNQISCRAANTFLFAYMLLAIGHFLLVVLWSISFQGIRPQRHVLTDTCWIVTAHARYHLMCAQLLICEI